MRSSFRLALFALLSISVINIFSATTAVAHSGVVSSNPSAGQVLTEIPDEISVTFSEELLAIEGKAVNTLTLTAQNGSEVPLAQIRVEGNLIRASVLSGDFPAGLYEMKYRVVSADGHEVSDLITFSIDTPIGIDVTPQSEPFVLPLPIVLAIALLIIVGGFFALERRRRAD